MDETALARPHHFHLNRSSGVLTVARPLDFEDTSLFSLDVVAKDCGNYWTSCPRTVAITRCHSRPRSSST